MPDENTVIAGGDQTTPTTQGPQTSSTQSNQTNDDFVLDFGEGSTSDDDRIDNYESTNLNGIENPSSNSIEENGDLDESMEGLVDDDSSLMNNDSQLEDDNSSTDEVEYNNKEESESETENKEENHNDGKKTENETNSDDDFNISLDETMDDDSTNYDSFDLSGNEEDTAEDNSDFQIDLDSSDEAGDEAGDDVGDETGDDIGNKTGDDIGNKTGDDIGNELSMEDNSFDISDDESQNDIQANDEELIDDTNTGDFIMDETGDSSVKEDENIGMDSVNKIDDIKFSDEVDTIEKSDTIDESNSTDSNIENEQTIIKDISESSRDDSDMDAPLQNPFESKIQLNNEDSVEGVNVSNETDWNQNNIQDTNNELDENTLNNPITSDDVDKIKTEANDTISQKNNSQILSFEQSINTQPEATIETQPNIQDYQDIQPSINNFQESEGSNQSMNIDLSDNTFREEDKIIDNQDGELQQEPQNIDYSTDLQQNQEDFSSQNDTNLSNGFYLNSTVNDKNTPSNDQNLSNQELKNQESIQENPIITHFNESESNLPDTGNNLQGINATQMNQESMENEINSTAGTENLVSNQETAQIQPTLSLDQILDSEILSNPKYSDNSITVSENSVTKQSSGHSNRMGTILVGLGIFILAGFVIVLAFPSGNSNRKNEIISTGNNIENSGHFSSDDILDIDFPDPTITGDISNSTPDLPISSGTQAVVEFPDPFDGSWDNELDDNELNNSSVVAIPYSGNNDFEDEEAENEKLLTNIMISISSFKSQAETYYLYGQEMSDKKIIKYASQMINACDTYQEQVSAGEGINQEAFSQFEENILGIISKIDEYNNGGSESPQIIQNNVETNENDYNFSEKEELKDYIYSR